jgi:hypothetical protein
LVVGLLGVVAVGVGLFRAFWPVAPGPAYRELSIPARGELERKVRQRPPDDGELQAEDLRLRRTAADIMVAQRNLLWVWLGCFLIQFGTALADWNSVHLLITVLFAMGIGGLALYFERRAEAGAVFLARHPATSHPILELSRAELGTKPALGPVDRSDDGPRR